MISAAAALALITLTQRDYCELSIEPYISIEDDVVAMRRVDPQIIELMPPALHFIAANTYYDEYLGFEGYFPWLNADQLMPATPPTHLARPREPGSDSAVEWESISAHSPDIIWPPDPYLRPGARFCMAQPFHFTSLHSSSAPPPHEAKTEPPPSALPPAPEPPDVQQSNLTAAAVPQPPLYKLSGFVVLAFVIGILAGSILSNRLWWQWRNRRNRQNFQTLLDDLAQQEVHKPPLRQRVNGVPPPPAQRVKKCTSVHASLPSDLKVHSIARSEPSLLAQAHASMWKCILSATQRLLTWRSRLVETFVALGMTFHRLYRRRRSRFFGSYERAKSAPPARDRKTGKRQLRRCLGAVALHLRSAAETSDGDHSNETKIAPSSPVRRPRSTNLSVSVSLARCVSTSKGCQTTGVKRVCASVQTPQALAQEDPPKRGGSLAGRGSHRTRRHNGNTERHELITDTSDVDENVMRMSPEMVPSAPTSPSTGSTAVCNRDSGQGYDASPPPGFEGGCDGGWVDHEEFLQTCQKLLDDMDNWDAPSGYTGASAETASTLGENDTSQDIHSLLFALTGKMDEDIAALLHNGARRCQSFN